MAAGAQRKSLAAGRKVPLEAAMTAALRAALASVIASSVLAGAAFAQTGNPAGRAYQVQQAQAQLRARPGQLGQLTAPRGGPRFIVEAVSFKAVDESGWTDWTNDEVFAIFRSGQHTMVTRLWGSVDSGETELFPTAQNCILPAVDTDGVNGRWACAPEGVQGPFGFTVTLYEKDPDLSYPWGGAFCAPAGSTDIVRGSCDTDNSNILFEQYYSYDVADILAHLLPHCRCAEETVRQRRDGPDSTYEFTVRITRVDTLPVLDRPLYELVQVHRSGTLTAALNQHFEFDGGVVVANNGDFAFTGVLGGNRLTPAGGARVWLGGAAARGYAACAAGAANYVTNAIAVPPIGTHACYITSDGRVGEFRVADHVANVSLTLSYTTWQQ